MGEHRVTVCAVHAIKCIWICMTLLAAGEKKGCKISSYVSTMTTSQVFLKKMLKDTDTDKVQQLN